MKKRFFGAALAALLVLLFGVAPAGGASGDLDPTFSADGKVVTDAGTAADIAVGNDVKVQPDGRVVVVGAEQPLDCTNACDTNILVLRYNPDGSLDTTFSGDGRVVIDLSATGSSDEFANAVFIQPDGRIVVVGNQLGTDDLDAVVVRLTSDGVLDTTFSENGIFTYDPADAAVATFDVAVDGANRVVVAGANDTDAVTFRLTAAGVLDTSFDTDGV